MHRDGLRKLFIAASAPAVVSLLVLWSFNTLAELFGGPMAQFRHSIAAVGLLLVVKWTRRSHGHSHEYKGGVCGH